MGPDAMRAALGEALYVVSPDGSHRVRLTRDTFENMLPAWSPDGKRIAFTSNAGGEEGRLGQLDIYIICADGSHRRRLTRLNGQSLSPAWSPDGKWIAFSQNPGSIHPTNTSRILLVEVAEVKHVTRHAVERVPQQEKVERPRAARRGPGIFRLIGEPYVAYAPAWQPFAAKEKGGAAEAPRP